jgi:hypothetical protein
MAKELDVNIGIFLDNQPDSGRWALYRGAIERTSRGPIINRPFVDRSGYSTLNELVETAHSQFQDFGGKNFVKIIINNDLESNLKEDLREAIKKKMGDIDIYSAHFEH